MSHSEILHYATNAKNLILEDSPTIKNMTPEDKSYFLAILIHDLKKEYAKALQEC